MGFVSLPKWLWGCFKMEALIFCFFFLSTIVSGIMVVSALNPVLSVFWLVLVFVNSAVFFL